jgi:hypothetical protein
MLGACQSKEPAPQPVASNAPTHATISNDITATAAVVAVDAKTRVVTVRAEDGNLVQIKCGEDVRNFAQIAVHDTLHVRYRESLEATRLPAGESATPATAVGASVGAEPGAAPAGGMGVAISARVKDRSLDVEHDIVVFSFASGELSARRVVTPEGREFVKGLKIGDTVQLDYTEVLALAIEKA